MNKNPSFCAKIKQSAKKGWPKVIHSSATKRKKWDNWEMEGGGGRGRRVHPISDRKSLLEKKENPSGWSKEIGNLKKKEFDVKVK